MQVTELPAEGLKREYKVVFSADEIEGRVQTRLQKLGQTVRMPGFRPGKAPLTLIKKQYGRAIMGEVLEEAAAEAQRQTIRDNGLKPALQPKIQLTAFDEGKDLELSVGVEILPDLPEVAIEQITLVKEVADIPPERVTAGIERLARARQKFNDLPEPRPAQDGDQLVMDFVGRIDGEAFQGGSAEDFRIVLGAGNMIPGFEDGLIGAEASKERVVEATFPDNYHVETLKGKNASFTVTVKEIKAPEPYAIDDEWAKGLGFESLEEVQNLFRSQVEGEHERMSRMKLKRALFDQLAAAHEFDVPTGLVDIEFDAIWKQIQDEMKRTNASFEDEGKSEEEVKADYRRIAHRRVRLGLLLSDIGMRHQVQVEPEELQRAAIERARQFPGQERQVFEALQKNQGMLEQLRAPLYEDKVCDLIFAKAQLEERRVSEEELMREPDDELAATAVPAEAAAADETAAEQKVGS